MMRRNPLLLLLIAVLAGCQGPAAPERRELLGSWASEGFGGGTIRMTLAETARSVDGAGSWTNVDQVLAFRVFGALARDEVSLFFDFPLREGINFQGYFGSADVLEGTLSGGEFRSHPVTFTRQLLPR
jgi:hypothetical protein